MLICKYFLRFIQSGCKCEIHTVAVFLDHDDCNNDDGNEDEDDDHDYNNDPDWQTT